MTKVRQRKNLRYVHTFTDRMGIERRYFRRRGCKSIPLPDDPASPEFRAAYSAALAGQPASPPPRNSGKKREAPPPDWIGVHADNPGVYLLFQGGEVVYVGTSLKMGRRVAAHRLNGRPFDAVHYIVTPRDQRFALERILIAAIRPKQNRAGAEIANTGLQPARAAIRNPPLSH